MTASSIKAVTLYLRGDGDAASERERERIADGLAAWLSGQFDTLDEALGLRGEPGKRSARTRLALEMRDEIVREAAAEFFPGLPPSAQAASIALYWSRYAASGWRRERELDAIPAAREGTVEGAFWRALKIRDHVLKERSVRAILADGVPKLAAS